MSESIAEFMERRRREIERLGRQAVDAAHVAYAEANRAGRDLALKTQSQVMQYGARLAETARPPAPTPRPAARRSTSPLETPSVRKAGGEVARLAGNALGLVEGAAHAAEGLIEGAWFASRLANPLLDALIPGEAAPAQLGQTVAKVVDSVAKGVSDPAGAVRAVTDKAREFRQKVDPTATPAAPTFSGELHRNFDIGRNQGEVAFDVGSVAIGGPAAKMTKHMVPTKAATPFETYLAQGFSARAAARLSEIYDGMGHHNVGRRHKLPEVFSESEFNVLKPPGMTRGDFYKLHYEVDPHFYGTGLPGREPWSGKRLGLKKHDQLGRLWHGAPTPLKARVIGLTAGAGAATHDLSQEDAR